MAAAVIAAGGSGRRVGGDVPKQFREVAGRPLLLWSFDAVRAAGIEQVVVVVPADRIDESMRALPDDVAVVAGGATRQASVRNGLARVTGDRVVVHDAARPFAPSGLFAAVLTALEHADAAVPGLPLDETVKIVRDGRVVNTLERTQVWRIQTPQAFRADALRDAHRRARDDGVKATDDAQLIERYGGSVAVVEGSSSAFKVTDAEDFERAERHARELVQ